MQPREDLSTIPFIGEVSGETPSACYLPEVRRKDVGQQMYGNNTPKFNSAQTDRHGLIIKKASTFTSLPTSHGTICIPSNEKQDLGFMPTADAVLFLKHEYLGSRESAPPQRYFPLPWR